MAFNLSEFTSQINRHGVAKSNLFVMRITLPARINFLNEEIATRDLTFLCRTVDIPSFSLETTPIKTRGFGPAETRPTGLEYTQLNTIFMVDSNFAVKKFFHRWMQEIVHYDVEQGYTNELPNGLLPYEFGYKDDYAATIEVIAYSGNSDESFYTYKFSGAFPTTIGNTQVAWENTAEIMTMPITFAYDEFKVDGTIQGTSTSLSNRGNGVLTYLSALNTYGQAISGLSLPTNIQDAVNLYTDVNTIIGSLK